MLHCYQEYRPLKEALSWIDRVYKLLETPMIFENCTLPPCTFAIVPSKGFLNGFCKLNFKRKFSLKRATLIKVFFFNVVKDGLQINQDLLFSFVIFSVHKKNIFWVYFLLFTYILSGKLYNSNYPEDIYIKYLVQSPYPFF